MSKNNIFENLKVFLGEHRNEVRKYVLLSLASPISEVLLPHFYGKVIDSLSKSIAKNVFTDNKSNIFAILGLWLLSQGMSTSLDMLDTDFIPKLTGHFRDMAVSKILKYYEEKGDDLEIGDLLCKILRLPTLMRDLFYQFRTYIVPVILILTSATGYLYYLDKGLGLLMLSGLIIFFFVLYKFAQESIIENKISIQKFDALHEEIIDVLSNATNIHNSNKLKEELDRLAEKQSPFNESFKMSLYRISLFKRIFSTTFFGIFSVLSAYIIKLYSEKKVDVASTSSALIVLLFIIVNLTDLSNNIRDFIFNISGIIDIQNFMDKMDTPQASQKYDENIRFLNNGIVFDNATIVTDEGNVLAKNLNFKIPSGQITVLKGPVGSGKSSILKAIIKNRRLESGDIAIGGVSIKEISPVDIRKYVAYVPQHPVLFNRPIIENILYGTNGTEPDVIKMIAHYNLTEIGVNDLHRAAGKNGNALSGGQKQIVLILRFLLRNSPIVLFDEPTSSLSPLLKSNILNLLQGMNDGTRTILITTHDEDVMKLANNTINLRKV